MTKPKIAFVTSIYMDSDFTSGGVKLNAMLLEGLKKRGYEIDLFSDNVVNNKINIVNDIYPLYEIYNRLDEYDKILSDKGVAASDITYIHDHSYPFRVKALQSNFSHFLYKIFNSKKHKKRLEEYRTVKQHLRNTKAIVVSSNILKEDLINNYELEENRIVIIPPPIENQQVIKRKRGSQYFSFGISAVGFERKGGYILLDAIRKLKKRNKNFRVNIIYQGTNIFVASLVYLYGIQEHCNFVGYFRNMNDFYSVNDCILMPSILEPFGMVATEAMSCGCPVITNEICGASDFVKDNFNGFVYKFPKDSSALAECMEKMINLNEEKYEKICQNAYESVKELSKEKFVETILSNMSAEPVY